MPITSMFGLTNGAIVQAGSISIVAMDFAEPFVVFPKPMTGIFALVATANSYSVILDAWIPAVAINVFSTTGVGFVVGGGYPGTTGQIDWLAIGF